MFEGRFYGQIDGVAMGSPLGPVLANLVMGYYEQNWLQLFAKFEVIYCRHMDDIICLFNSEYDADSFVYLNQQHSNVKFTIEKPMHNQLLYLDLLITNNVDKFLSLSPKAIH